MTPPCADTKITARGAVRTIVRGAPDSMVADGQVAENRFSSDAGRQIVLAVFAAALILVHWGLADFNPEPYGTVPIDGAEVELFAPAGGSPLLIFAVSALLIFGRRKQLASSLGDKAALVPGLALLLLGAALGRWADLTSSPELLIPSLIAWLLALAALLAGMRGLKSIAAPTVFLIFAFPIPAALVNALIWPLQLATATSADWFLRAVGYAPEHLGDFVVLAGHTFHVIETCSGLRTIETLTMAAALYAMLFYRNRWQVIALLLFAPLLAYVVNFARVLSIIFNPYAQWSTVHTLQGVVMLVAGVLVIAGFDNLLERFERNTKTPLKAASAAATLAVKPGLVVALASSLLLAGLCNALVPKWTPLPTPEAPALRLPKKLAGAAPRSLRLNRQFLGSVGIAKWLHREYDYLDSTVRIQILANDRLERRGSLLSAKTAIPKAGFQQLSREVVALPSGAYVDRYYFKSRDRRVLVYHWYEGMASTGIEIVRSTLSLDRGPTRRNQWALSVQFSTEVSNGNRGLAQADARLAGFTEVVRKALE